jgi:hypothetical protein
MAAVVMFGSEGGTYVLIKCGKCLTSDGKEISKDRVKELSRNLGCSEVYGILYKYRNKISSDWEEISAKALLEAGALRNSKEVENYIKYGPKNLESFVTNTTSVFLKKNISELNDQRLIDLIEKDKLVEAGQQMYYKYQRLSNGCCQVAEAAKGQLEKDFNSLKSDYPAITKWNEMDYYYDNKSDRKAIQADLIFYLNAKYAAKVAALGATNADS